MGDPFAKIEDDAKMVSMPILNFINKSIGSAAQNVLYIDIFDWRSPI